MPPRYNSRRQCVLFCRCRTCLKSTTDSVMHLIRIAGRNSPLLKRCQSTVPFKRKLKHFYVLFALSHTNHQKTTTFKCDVVTCTGMRITRIPRNPQKSRGMKANVAGFTREWKDMSRDSRGNGKSLRNCNCIGLFWCTAINLQISASAIHFHNTRQRVNYQFTITACTVVQAVVKATSQSNGKGQILTPLGSETLERISMKLAIYNRVAGMPTPANACGAATTWVVWANTCKKHVLWFLR